MQGLHLSFHRRFLVQRFEVRLICLVAVVVDVVAVVVGVVDVVAVVVGVVTVRWVVQPRKIFEYFKMYQRWYDKLYSPSSFPHLPPIFWAPLTDADARHLVIPALKSRKLLPPFQATH